VARKPRVELAESRFGEVVRRYLYLWDWSLAGAERERFLARSTPAAMQDMLAAVRPFLDEIEVAFEDPEMTAGERHALADFLDTYRQVLAHFVIPLAEVKDNWDVTQITGDRRQNQLLFQLCRGLDLRELGIEQDESCRLIVRAWTDLVHLSKRRTLPKRVQKLLEEAAPVVQEIRRGVPSVESAVRRRQQAEAEAEDPTPVDTHLVVALDPGDDPPDDEA
jgi:hypothetical protein